MTAPQVETDGRDAWELLLGALIEEVDSAVERSLRDGWLRGAGVRLARQRTLPAATTLASFEAMVNAELSGLGWGEVHVDLDAAAQILTIAHDGVPTLAGARRDGSLSLVPFFEGLHSGWLGQQRTVGGAYLSARERTPRGDGHSFVLVYGRADRLAAAVLADPVGGKT